MSRSYATIQCSIWDDEDFKALSAPARDVYFMLVTQHDITACGTLPLVWGRWAGYVAADDRDALRERILELSDARFVVVDGHTEELLVRTFVKYDAGYKHATRVKAVTSSADAIRSTHLRGVLKRELLRLDVPLGPVMRGTRVPLESHSSPTQEALESHSSGTELSESSTFSSGTGEALERHSSPTGVPLESHLIRNVVTSRLTTEPHSTILKREPVGLESHPNGNRPPEHCTQHPGGTDQPCGACARARRLAADWDADQAIADRAAAKQRRRLEREAAQLERDACNLCDTAGYRILDDLGPRGPITGQWCNHQPLNPGGLKRALEQIEAEQATQPEQETAQP